MPPSVPESLDLPLLTRLLGERAPAFQLQLVRSCPSTNSALLAVQPDPAGRLQVLACEAQTAGRGRRGRAWLSWGADSLTFSVACRFAPGHAAPAGLSLAAGVAVAQALEGLGVAGVALKWPNDVLLANGKLAGILVELSQGGRRPLQAVIGIGLNLRVPDAPLPDGALAPAGLWQAGAARPSRNQVLAALLLELDSALREFGREGFGAFRARWSARNAYQDKPVRVEGEAGSPLDGLCAGVDGDGALLLETPDGPRRVVSGDVSLRGT